MLRPSQEDRLFELAIRIMAALADFLEAKASQVKSNTQEY